MINEDTLTAWFDKVKKQQNEENLNKAYAKIEKMMNEEIMPSLNSAEKLDICVNQAANAFRLYIAEMLDMGRAEGTPVAQKGKEADAALQFLALHIDNDIQEQFPGFPRFLIFVNEYTTNLIDSAQSSGSETEPSDKMPSN